MACEAAEVGVRGNFLRPPGRNFLRDGRQARELSLFDKLRKALSF